MSIFQKSVIQKYKKGLNTVWLNTAYAKFNEIFNSKKIERIKNFKEEEYQDGFLRDLFVDVLGYTLKTDDENFNLVREFKNQTNSKKADGAIIKDEKAVTIIELKSTKTKDLTSITEQAFNYKNNQPGCKYVITSNFQKLRFYIDYTNEYEEFDLFNLQKTDFELLYLILRKKSIFENFPQKLKDETRFHEEEISKQLYKDYSNLKNNIFENLVKNNAKIEKLTLFKKTQKLLDRLLFIFFAEDCGLLPPNSIVKIIDKYEQLKKLDYKQPLYDIYKQYFRFMNTGKKGKTSADDIPAYNGGLFTTDKLLDSFKIDDNILKTDCLKMSAYDFSTEVDVNILGQIFEHSLNEIEEIEKKLLLDIETSEKSNFKTASKRKKDGVFYTPKYITQYIVENTIGTLCRQKRKEMNIYEIEFDDGYRTKKGLNKKGKQLYKKLNDYKKWLNLLKIIDPACGSGAFLNQALDFLIKENIQIDNFIAELTKQKIRLFDTDKTILENNLYGVDINEESVEIAKLSLWLRTAQKGRKLSHLNNNIKCGNSLIADNSLNYNKIFNWKKEFADIMKNGGFDVVIGNPPYIKEYTNRHAFNHLHNHYCYQGKMDLWYFFGCIALELVKKDTGLIGYIAPNNWITNAGASKFRNVILQKAKLTEFIDFGNFKVFDSAGIQTMIYIMKRSNDNENYELNYSKIIENKINHEKNQEFLEKKLDKHFVYFKTTLNKEKYLNKTINFNTKDVQQIATKIKNKQNFIFDEKEIAQGIVIPQDYLNKKNKEILGEKFKVGEGIFVLSKEEIKELRLSKKEYELLKPYYYSKNFEKYFANSSTNLLIIYTNTEFKNEEKIKPYPNIKQHLDKFKDVITSDNKPYGLHRTRDDYFFHEEKIIVQRKCPKKPIFAYTNFDCYVSAAFYVIKTNRLNQKYLTGLLNSKLIEFWLKFKGKMQGNNYQIDKAPLLNLPIIKPDEKKQTEIANLVSKIIDNKNKKIDYKTLLEQTRKEHNFDREIKLTKELEKISTAIKTAENNIDNYIYKLYELSDNDIYTIENEIND